MKGRTARAIQRLKQSPDFKDLVEYLTEELDISKQTLVILNDRDKLLRVQGEARSLTKLLKAIAEADLISKKD